MRKRSSAAQKSTKHPIEFTNYHLTKMKSRRQEVKRREGEDKRREEKDWTGQDSPDTEVGVLLPLLRPALRED